MHWVHRRRPTHFAVAATNQNEVHVGRPRSCLIGRSDGELGRFTARSLPLSAVEMMLVEIR